MGKLTDYNYEQLKKRIEYSLEYTNKDFYEKLESIKGTTLITGVGGSLVVAIFLKKILERKNNNLCVLEELDQITNECTQLFQNLIIISSSGKNHGVTENLKKDFKRKYLFTRNKKEIKEATLLNYEMIDQEKSFISLANTLVPITILLKYYTKKDKPRKIEIQKWPEIKNNLSDWEVFYDEASKGTAYFLESTFIEAGLGNIILHDKYSYCHGRSTLASKRKGECIYLLSKKNDLDLCLLENIKVLYHSIYILKSNEKDSILIDYDLLLQAYGFVYQIAKNLKRDLSKVKYAKIVSTLYHFKGEM